MSELPAPQCADARDVDTRSRHKHEHDMRMQASGNPILREIGLIATRDPTHLTKRIEVLLTGDATRADLQFLELAGAAAVAAGRSSERIAALAPGGALVVQPAACDAQGVCIGLNGMVAGSIVATYVNSIMNGQINSPGEPRHAQNYDFGVLTVAMADFVLCCRNEMNGLPQLGYITLQWLFSRLPLAAGAGRAARAGLNGFQVPLFTSNGIQPPVRARSYSHTASSHVVLM